LQAFEYARVSSIDEAIALLAEGNGNARVLSGGTDLLVALREDRITANVVVDVKGIPELNEMFHDRGGGLVLGAAVSCHRMYNDEAVSRDFPGLIDSATLIGGVQIQGRAGFGGNLCNASPAADSIPSLIAHGATAVIAGPDGRREVAVEEFCVAPGRTVLGPGEFLVKLRIPAPGPGFGAAYQRFIPRNEMDIAVVGVGTAVQLNEGRTHFESARIALGAVAPTPLFVPEAGESLAGKKVTEESIQAAAAIAVAAAKPINDMRGTADFRKHLVGVLTRRTLAAAIERAR
jgi:CO/xanthine dehydrogenase FAD-binding subunit